MSIVYEVPNTEIASSNVHGYACVRENKDPNMVYIHLHLYDTCIDFYNIDDVYLVRKPSDMLYVV